MPLAVGVFEEGVEESGAMGFGLFTGASLSSEDDRESLSTSLPEDKISMEMTQRDGTRCDTERRGI